MFFFVQYHVLIMIVILHVEFKMFSLSGTNSQKTSRIKIGARDNFAHTSRFHCIFNCLLLKFPLFPSFFSVCSTFPEGNMLFPGSFASSFEGYNEPKRKRRNVKVVQFIDQASSSFTFPFIATQAQFNKSSQCPPHPEDYY